jgi:hypothetical protein
MISGYFAYLAIFASFIGISFYVVDIFKGHTRPNLVSWFIWMLAPFIGAYLQIKAGAGLSVIPVFMAGFVCVPVLLASLIKRNGYFKIGLLDIFCGILSLFALILYIITRNTNISILFAILADGLAAVPTLIKSWKFPESGSYTGYIAGIFNNIIALLVIKDWSFSIYSFSLYIIAINTAIIFAIYRKRIFT